MIADAKEQFCAEHIGKTAFCHFKTCQNKVVLDKSKRPSKGWILVYCSMHTCPICNTGQPVMSENKRFCYSCGLSSTNPVVLQMRQSENKPIPDHLRCAYYKCKDKRVETYVSMGDIIYDPEFCFRHAFLNELCREHYGFSISDLRILDFMLVQHGEEDDKHTLTQAHQAAHSERRGRRHIQRIELLIGLKRAADLVCKTPDGGQPHFIYQRSDDDDDE
jgi:hypothetical protein